MVRETLAIASAGARDTTLGRMYGAEALYIGSEDGSEYAGRYRPMPDTGPKACGFDLQKVIQLKTFGNMRAGASMKPRRRSHLPCC